MTAGSVAQAAPVGRMLMVLGARMPFSVAQGHLRVDWGCLHVEKRDFCFLCWLRSLEVPLYQPSDTFVSD